MKSDKTRANLQEHLEANKIGNKGEEDKEQVCSNGVFLVQCLLDKPETTTVTHLLPPAQLDNGLDGEITAVQFW